MDRPCKIGWHLGFPDAESAPVAGATASQGVSLLIYRTTSLSTKQKPGESRAVHASIYNTTVQLAQQDVINLRR